MLEARSLSVAYGPQVAVAGVSLALEPGKITGLAGESGSGKTTLALSLAGYPIPGSRVTGGRVLFGGRGLQGLSPKALRELWGAGIAYLPQDASTALNPALRIGSQVSEVLRAHRRPASGGADLLARVGLREPEVMLRRHPHELSGGEQQRVALALAIACDPDVLLLDEPTTGLDRVTQARVVELIESLTRELEMATLLVSHDLPLLASVCDELYVMYAGEIVEHGPADEVADDPRHPYTAALVQALPAGGTAPLSSAGERCGYADRCPLAADDCLQRIELREVAAGREVRCVRDAVELPVRAAHVPAEVHGAPALSVDRLRCAYGSKVVLDGVSLGVATGSVLGVAGESGSGKTTLLRALAGLIAPAGGEITLAGRQLTPERTRADRQAIQIVFQNPDATLNPRHTVMTALGRPLALFRDDVPRARRRDEAAATLERLELSPRLLDRLPRELSAGQRQRVAIARALIARPQVLLCDEITSALDRPVQAAVIDLLSGLRAELAIVFVSHDRALLDDFADEIVELDRVIRALLALAALAAAPASTLRLAEMTPPTLDPALASSPDAVMFQNAICDRLYTTTAAGAAVPQIAAALPVAGPNAQRPKQWTTYTIRLKSRYRFADGSPVTAYSFADAIGRDADPDMASPALGQLKNVVGVAAVAASEASIVSGVRAVNDTTLQIATLRREPSLAALLAEPYFCPVEEDTPVAPGGIGVPPSAGPYYVKQNVPGEIVLVRNPYYGGTRKAKFAQIDLETGVGFNTCRTRAQAGKVDICLDALPQHAAKADPQQLVSQGWIAKSVGCLSWEPVIRLDLTNLCRG